MKWLCVLLVLAVSVAESQTLTVVSAASFEKSGAIAPDMIATAFSSAIVPPLSGYSIAVRDAPARVLATAEGQISFIVPPTAAMGEATITLRSQDRAVATANARIAAVAPGIFTANSSGMGAPAGHFLQVNADESRSTSDLFQSGTGGIYLPRPFFNSPGQLYLILYGTGLRGRRGNITTALGGRSVPVLAAVAHGTLAGLD